MSLNYILAAVQAALAEDVIRRKRCRYRQEEVTLQRVRTDLETCDREQWLLDTLETEDTLG